MRSLFFIPVQLLVCSAFPQSMEDQLACCAAQVMLLIFLSIGTLLIACFLGYHCSLIVKGMTSYETFKWQDYKAHCKAVAQDSRYASCTERLGTADVSGMLVSKADS